MKNLFGTFVWCINISAVMPASLYSQVHQSSVGAGTGFTLPSSSEITMDPGGGGMIDARSGGGMCIKNYFSYNDHTGFIYSN